MDNDKQAKALRREKQRCVCVIGGMSCFACPPLYTQLMRRKRALKHVIPHVLRTCYVVFYVSAFFRTSALTVRIP
jgi:hypothetical protein